jgi:hypothetical protein
MSLKKWKKTNPHDKPGGKAFGERALMALAKIEVITLAALFWLKQLDLDRLT